MTKFIIAKCQAMKYKVVKHLCPKCGHKKARWVHTCIIYDEYFICEKCGLCDFSASKRLTPEEDEARSKAIDKYMKKQYVSKADLKLLEKIDFS